MAFDSGAERTDRPVQWQASKLSAVEPLAPRVSKKLRTEEMLLTVFAPTRHRMELDGVPLWTGNHLMIAKLFEHFASYLYLPRLRDSRVLVDAIQRGIALLTWRQESFAYADSYDEAAERFVALVAEEQISIATAPSCLRNASGRWIVRLPLTLFRRHGRRRNKFQGRRFSFGTITSNDERPQVSSVEFCNE